MYSQTVMTLSLAIGKFNVLTNSDSKIYIILFNILMNSDDFEFGNR